MKLTEINTDKIDNSSPCKYFRSDTENCQVGCKKIKVIANNFCPFEGTPKKDECPCYVPR
jgi:hypothetical protein